ncbi:MAG TPA: IS110 family transposase [Candidatus Acidoferrales bacterium]|jgi:transposase|nr:IS110 family transposase [Candidatus Acidoferrales bacterium]
MLIIGADYHPGFQQIAFVDQATGEYGQRKLSHPGEAESFYRSLSGQQVRVGMEATGHARWFERLLAELKYELWIGDPAAIRANRVRKQKNDRQDAELLLRLLVENRFPRIWVPSPENRDLRQLLWHRHRLVQMRTRIQNQLQAIALNEGVRRKKALWSKQGREQLESLPLPTWSTRRRQDLLQMLDGLEPRIDELSAGIKREAEQRPEVQRLMTHPGVGPTTALAFVLILVNTERFACGKQIGSYLGLVPSEESSGGRQRLGHISKQGNVLLRFLLIESANVLVRCNVDWRRRFAHLAMRRGRTIAKVAVARRLAVHLYWMWRKGQTYQQASQFGSHVE